MTDFPEDLLADAVLRDWVDALARLVEAAGASVIFIGAVIAVVRFLVVLASRHRDHEFGGVRLSLGRYLVLGLEFQLASDVLRTAVAPSYEEIGKLAAIAAIRTVLNFFLQREIDAEDQRAHDRSPGSGATAAAPPAPRRRHDGPDR